MRFLMKVNIPVETGNAAAKAGKLGSTIHSILADMKPQAAYFSDSDGQTHGLLVLRDARCRADSGPLRALVSGL